MRRSAVVTMIITLLMLGLTSGVGCLPAPGSGNVQVLVTDKPFPFEFIESAVVTITEVQLRAGGAVIDESDDGIDDEGAVESQAQEVDDAGDTDDVGDADEDVSPPFVTIFEGEKSFDLLQLQNGKTDLLADAEVPAGTYTQMRLVVTDGVLTLNDGRVFDLDVPSGAQSGIKLNFTFTVGDGEQKQLLLDVDLSTAFQAVPGGKIDDPSTIREFKFRPSLAMRLIDLVEAGSVSGTVTDDQGTPLADVSVTAVADGEEVTTASTAADGTYVLPALEAGTYTVDFSLSGYADASVTGVTVAAGEQTAGVDIALAAE